MILHREMLDIEEKKLNELEGFGSLSDVYFISNEGELVSYARNGRLIRKPMTNSKGYLGFRINNISMKLHRLVAIAFIPNPNNYAQVNHIDGDKKNNKAENLEWCTNTYNMRHSWEIGLRKAKKGSDNYQWSGDHENCKKVAKKTLENKTIAEYNSIAIASRENTGFSPSGISRVCNGKTKSYKGYIWEFVF